MKRLSLVNLETLCTIARLGSFQAAADKLNSTQPTISSRVREMENVVGRPLFQRHGRRMELSIEGRQLVDKAEPLLGSLADLLVTLDDPSAATGLVRIGLGEIIAETWFPRFIREAMRLMPNLNFEVKVDLTVQTRQDLENGKLDLALIGGNLASGALTAVSLGMLETQWVCSPLLLGEEPHGYALDDALTRFPVWSLAKASLLYPVLAQEIRNSSARVSINLCDSISAMIGILVSGAGLGLLPGALVAEQLNNGTLVCLGARTETTLPMVAAWRTEEKQIAVLKLAQLAKKVSTFPVTPRRAFHQKT
jgi:DNA-binding transcriptional LysR family regulator